MDEWIAQALAGNRRALARLITLVERGRAHGRTPEAEAVVRALYPRTGRAHIIGVTGPPGSGKSSLVNALAQALRGMQRTVGIVAVDPSSPFTGGALLGDRVRMADLYGDPGIFIRSMASRGNLGGLALATGDAVKVLDAVGFDVILIETVGAGQAEVEIAGAAHTVLVVETPGMGDEVQSIKAGILEIADVLVVNKADRPGADATVRALRAMLQLGHSTRALGYDGRQQSDLATAEWTPPIVETVAVTGQGIESLTTAVLEHYRFLRETGVWLAREKERSRHELERLVIEQVLARVRARVSPGEQDELVTAVATRAVDPASAAEQLLAYWRAHVAD